MLTINHLWALVLLVCAYRVGADTPADCRYEQIRGVWVFSESERTADRSEKCDGSQHLVNKVRVELQYPNTAVDQFGNKGTWTLIYNQGFEVIVNNRKYFAFSNYTQKGSVVTSYCHQTSPGWSHDVLGHNWACYTGERVTGDRTPNTHIDRTAKQLDGVFTQSPDAIQKINAIQKSWTARHYPQFEGMSRTDMYLMSGGPKSRILSPPSPAPVTPEVSRLAAQLPDHFDWRDVNGVNFVSDVRNQGGCGSCYAFGAIGMIEGRLRVLTNNTEAVDLSEQDVVSCSAYSQKCDGGFPYLIAGRYGQDFGLTLESTVPYTGRNDKCATKATAERYYTAEYHYVGGYYGACNEELMRLALVNNGPLAVSFEVYGDFSGYQGGIYKHTKVSLSDSNAEFDPFAITNHVVTIVGYGTDDKTGQKYWIVKNSWGAGWGLKGYFLISRGNNEANIESIAVEATPIPNKNI